MNLRQRQILSRPVRVRDDVTDRADMIVFVCSMVIAVLFAALIHAGVIA